MTEATVSITDDDDPEVTVSFEADAYSVAEGGSAGVKVTLSADPERNVTIPIVTMGQGGVSSTDYSGVPSGVTFVSGETEKTITFMATLDTLDDDGESVKLAFGTMPDERVNPGTPDETTIDILDDDDPQVTVSFEMSAYSANEGGTVDVTVTLSANPERTVVIPITKTEQGATTADYSGVPDNVTFNSGEMSQSFTFTAVDDTLDDDDESVKLAFGAMPDARVNPGTPDEATVSITDDDDPEVTVSFEAGAYSADEGGTVDVTVTLSADPERTVTIDITKTEQGGALPADYSGVPANVTFNDGGPTEMTFTFTATDDDIDDDGESVKLAFGTMPDARVSLGTNQEATVSIDDDDGAGVTVSKAALEIDEESSDTYTVVLDSQPTTGVTVTINDPPGSTGVTAEPASLTFGTGDWSSAKTVTVSAAADDDADDGTATVTHTVTSADAIYNGASAASVDVSVIDNDDPEVTVSFEAGAYSVAEGGSVGVKVTLSADPERNVTIPIVTMGQGGASSTDYSGVPSGVTFVSGETEKTITFMATLDTRGRRWREREAGLRNHAGRARQPRNPGRDDDRHPGRRRPAGVGVVRGERLLGKRGRNGQCDGDAERGPGAHRGHPHHENGAGRHHRRLLRRAGQRHIQLGGDVPVLHLHGCG